MSYPDGRFGAFDQRSLWMLESGVVVAAIVTLCGIFIRNQLLVLIGSVLLGLPGTVLVGLLLRHSRR